MPEGETRARETARRVSIAGLLTFRSGSSRTPEQRKSERLSEIRHRLAPSVALLPILGAYVLICIVTSQAAGFGDEANYLGYARNLTHGFYAQTHSSNPAAYLWHGPGLPVLLAPLVALHIPLGVMRILVGPVLLFASLVVFHRLVRLYASERTALVATYVLSVYRLFFAGIGVIAVEPLATLCFTLAVYFVVRSFRGGRHDHIWAGVALAALALSRVEYGYVLLAGFLLSGVWLLAARRSPMARRSVLAMVVALLLCTPWLIYTYSLTSKPFYWGNSGGLSLYWMTAPGNLGDWHPIKSVFTNPQLAADRPVFTQLQGLTPLAQDARLEHIALKAIEHDPNHYLSNVVNNVERLFFDTPDSFTYESESLGYALPNALLLGVLFIALLVAVRVRKRLEPEILVIAVLTLLGFLVHVPVAAYARFLVPLVPVALWLAIAVIAPNVRLLTERESPRGASLTGSGRPRPRSSG